MDVNGAVQLGQTVGAAGAILLLLALATLHYGFWYPRSTVELLQARIRELQVELKAERAEHRSDNDESERRVFNALGVADKITSIVAHAAVRGGRRAS